MFYEKSKLRGKKRKICSNWLFCMQIIKLQSDSKVMTSRIFIIHSCILRFFKAKLFPGKFKLWEKMRKLWVNWVFCMQIIKLHSYHVMNRILITHSTCVLRFNTKFKRKWKLRENEKIVRELGVLYANHKVTKLPRFPHLVFVSLYFQNAITIQFDIFQVLIVWENIKIVGELAVLYANYKYFVCKS